MKLKLIGIEDKGSLDNERIVIRALEDSDVGRYAIFKTRKVNETQVSNKVIDTFWFQDKLVKKGDWVVVYSKKGLYKSHKNDKGVTSHFFYWDRDAAFWNATDAAVVLLNTNEWEYVLA